LLGGSCNSNPEIHMNVGEAMGSVPTEKP
jgi:hypothetical protein